MLNFLLNNWVNLLLVLVGLSAFGVYFWQKNDEKRTAATLVKGQIDVIEERVGILKNDHQLGSVAVYHSRTILQENLWEKYKHQLIKELSKNDADIIQSFFDNAEQIEHARSDIIITIKNAWKHKSLVEHQKVAEYMKSEIDSRAKPKDGTTEIQVDTSKIELFKQLFFQTDLVFTPEIAINALVKHLSSFDMLSGTVAYAKIQKMSYEK